MDYSRFVDRDDVVEPSYGFTGDLLPEGWYPCEVVSVEFRASEDRSPQANVGCTVTEGPHAGRRLFDTFYLAPSAVKNGVARTDKEIKEAGDKINGIMNGWLKSIGVPKNKMPAAPITDPTYLQQFYNIDSWTGKQVMIKYRHKKDKEGKKTGSGSFGAYAALEDPKNGIAAYRNAPKQAAGGERGVGKTAPVTIDPLSL